MLISSSGEGRPAATLRLMLMMDGGSRILFFREMKCKTPAQGLRVRTSLLDEDPGPERRNGGLE
jgi:hypothetical protein